MNARASEQRQQLRAATAAVLRSPLFWIGACIVIAHGPYLFGILDPNPMLQHSQLTEALGTRLAHGADTLDPNDGFTAQSLEHRAMIDWLHGQVPWWNPFEGLGTPLAGEMQSAAFFPLALLVLFSNGQVALYFLLGLIAAYSTYFLLRRLGLSAPVAAVGAVCFGLNGTFAWFRLAPANPVCFLPLLLLGIEIVHERAGTGRRSHWWVIAVALALSLVAGFPSTAYIDGLLAGVWVIARCVQMPRARLRAFISAILAGVLSGLLLAAPLLVAIAAYLPYVSLGPNAHAASYALAPHALATLFFPYAYGPLWGNLAGPSGQLVGQVWGPIGGYLTAALLLLAALGLFGREQRALKFALAAWTVVLLAAAYGAPVIRPLVDLLPAMNHLYVFRYMSASVSMAVVVLAAFGVRNLLEARVPGRRLGLVSAAVAAGAAAAAVRAFTIYRGASPATGVYVAVVGWGFATIAAITAVAVILRRGDATKPGRDRRRRVAVAVLLALLPLEAIGDFVVPELGAPASGRIDTGVVSYLREHIGDQRFLALGPFQPNYGSYFGVASINVNDLPIPSAFSALVTRHLDPNSYPYLFTGTVSASSSPPNPTQAFHDYFSSYQQLGVKYVMIDNYSSFRRPRLHLNAAGVPRRLRGLGLKLVYSDALVNVYRLPDPTPLFSSPTPGCSLDRISFSEVRADCTRPGVLIRNELYLPGWTVSLNGAAARLSSSSLHQQRVALPPGHSTLVFNYGPPLAREGWLALLLGFVACGFSGGLFRRRGRGRGSAREGAAHKLDLLR